MTLNFLYLYDPLCGWCYGASAGIARLAAHPDTLVDMLPAGSFAGPGARTLNGTMRAHILASDDRIAEATGAVFGDGYRNRIVGSGAFRLDSGPATLALSAVAQTAPDRERDALGRIQRARYADGQDILAVPVLVDLLAAAGLDDAARALADPAPALHDGNRQRIDRAQSVMRRFGVSGVPALFRRDGDALFPVDASALYRDPLALVRTETVA